MLTEILLLINTTKFSYIISYLAPSQVTVGDSRCDCPCITTGANSFDGLRPLGPSKFIEGKNWKKFEIEKVRESGQSTSHRETKESSDYYQQQRGYHKGGVAHGRKQHFWDPSVFSIQHRKLFWEEANMPRLHRCPDWQWDLILWS